MPQPKILFILKRRSIEEHPTATVTPASYSIEDYPADPTAAAVTPTPVNVERTSGLLNSVRFITDMLHEAHVECEAVQVVDNNDIHREVTRYQPTHVVIEALWVVPEKFEILQELCPKVQWLVRIHSEIPFLANEGVAMDWITRCVQYDNVSIATNSVAALLDVRQIIASANPKWNDTALNEKVTFLPNYYPHRAVHELHAGKPGTWAEPEAAQPTLNVGCFGAIRPMKNNLLQAVAAIRYADEIGVKLNFHVNADRNEQGGDNALKNLRGLFSATPHTLVEHPWASHEEFLGLLRGMSLSLCVSLSETFCIVAADSVALDVPTVVSSEIDWASPWATADATDSESIVKAISRVMHPWFRKLGKTHNVFGLRSHCENAREVWLKHFEECKYL